MLGRHWVLANTAPILVLLWPLVLFAHLYDAIRRLGAVLQASETCLIPLVKLPARAPVD